MCNRPERFILCDLFRTDLWSHGGDLLSFLWSYTWSRRCLPSLVTWRKCPERCHATEAASWPSGPCPRWRRTGHFLIFGLNILQRSWTRMALRLAGSPTKGVGWVLWILLPDIVTMFGFRRSNRWHWIFALARWFHLLTWTQNLS